MALLLGTTAVWGAARESPGSSPGAPVLGRWTACAVALAGGLALWLSFPPFDLWPLAALGPFALSLATRGRTMRSGALLGLLLGSGFFLPLLSWTGTFVGDGPWIALALTEAGFVAALGGAVARVGDLRAGPVCVAALWVAQEAARSRLPFGGFPWGRLGFGQASSPLASLAAYVGVPLVSFAVALVGAALAESVLRAGRCRRSSSWGPATRWVAEAGVVPVIGDLAWLPLPGAELAEGGPAAVVAVVQGDVPRAGLDFNAQRRAVLDNHVRQTLSLARQVEAGQRPRPDFVIWPENSSDIDPFQNADAAAAIERAARGLGVPILVGAVLDGPGKRLTNAGIVWDASQGPGDRYAKRHPVPFGEYMPARSFFRIFSDQVDLLRRDFAAGEEPGVLEIGGVRTGDAICFEVAFDGLVSDLVDGGATMLVVQTNNATFGYTAESEQQLAMGRLRAVEYGRSVVVAATSGISAVIAPDGTVVERSDLFTPDVFVQTMAQRQERTVPSRIGSLPEWTLTTVGVVALAFAVLSRRRRRDDVDVRAGATVAPR